jgi:hypothetical protein
MKAVVATLVLSFVCMHAAEAFECHASVYPYSDYTNLCKPFIENTFAECDAECKRWCREDYDYNSRVHKSCACLSGSYRSASYCKGRY